MKGIFKNRYAIIITTCVFFLFIVNYYRASSDNEYVTVKQCKAEMKTIQHVIHVRGKVVVENSYHLLTPFSGIIKDITTNLGDNVSKGQILAEMDTEKQSRELSEAVLKMEAQVADYNRELNKYSEVQMEIQSYIVAREMEELSYYKKTMGSYKILFEQGAISEREYTDMKLKLSQKQSQCNIEEARLKEMRNGLSDREKDVYRANIELYRSSIGNIEQTIKKSRITSPFDGVVVDISGRKGYQYSEGTLLMTIGDLGETKIEAKVSESDFYWIKKGLKVEVIPYSMLERRYNGYIDRISPVATSGKNDQTSIGIIVKLIPGSHNDIMPETNVDLDIIVQDKHEALIIPIDTIIDLEGDNHVAVIGNDGKVHFKKIEYRQGNEMYYEVIDGPTSGDTIVRNPTPDLNGKYIRTEGK